MSVQDPRGALPQEHPQRALAQLLVGCLNQSGQPHDVALGALMSVYADIALKNPCCLSESARITSQVLALFNRHLRAAAAAAAPVEPRPMDHLFAQAGASSPEMALLVDLQRWFRDRAEPDHAQLNVLISLYRHLALQLPEHTEAAALATSAIAGELLSHCAGMAQAQQDAAATTPH
jgi:hypothetical protein